VAAGLKKAVGAPYDLLGVWIAVGLAVGVALSIACDVGFRRTFGSARSHVRLLAAIAVLARAELFARRSVGLANHDDADGYAVDLALMGSVGRQRLDEALLVARMNGDDDLVGREGRERVADGEIDVRLTGDCLDRLSGELLGGALGDSLGVTERLLVVGEPVEDALAHDRHDHLERVGIPDP
jgi:hypothetical protein